MRGDGSGEAQRMTNVENQWRPQAVSPDGKGLAVIQPGSGGVPILMVPIEGGADHPQLGKTCAVLSNAVRYDLASILARRTVDSVQIGGNLERETFGCDHFPDQAGQWQVSTNC
jgi:hypothetical protein